MNDGRVALERGLRGLLVRKRRHANLTLRIDQIGLVRFAPARLLVGYVQVVQRGAEVEPGYLSTIRDGRTVTFVTRSRRWLRLAEEIAGRTGAELDISPAQTYWKTIRPRR